MGKKGLEQKLFLCVGFSARVRPSQPDERTLARPCDINPRPEAQNPNPKPFGFN